jgi:hypothetical protein
MVSLQAKLSGRLELTQSAHSAQLIGAVGVLRRMVLVEERSHDIFFGIEFLNISSHRESEARCSLKHDEHESPEDHLATNLCAALLKLHKYYNKLDLSPAYYAATILYPRYKHYLDAA